MWFGTQEKERRRSTCAGRPHRAVHPSHPRPKSHAGCRPGRPLWRRYQDSLRTGRQEEHRLASRRTSCFRLTKQEFDDLRSQFVISNRGGRRYPPYAFTEQGVAMLSSVLRSERAIRVNIEIMRAFVELRSMPATHAESHAQALRSGEEIRRAVQDCLRRNPGTDGLAGSWEKAQNRVFARARRTEMK